MGATLSTPEKIQVCARKGDHAPLKVLLTDLARNVGHYGPPCRQPYTTPPQPSLQVLLTDLARHDRQFQANRASYLEVQDEQGNTALTAAAARGSYPCVELLLQHGSNVHHCSRRPEGGTALHEAVARGNAQLVELLLQAGASAFVENSRGFTPMDAACSTRNVTLLRRLERLAPFAGWLMMKVARFGGLGSEWQRRWCVVCHRYPYAQAPPAARVTHVVLLAYKTTQSTVPSCRVWLDGARAREVYNPKALARVHAHGPAQAGITLHRKHDAPAGTFVTGGGGSEGYTLYLRPDDGGQPAVDALQALIALVNNRGIPVAPPPVASPAAASPAAASPAAQQMGFRYEMANAPGAWNFTPLAAGAGQQGESDEAMARRMQERYDAEMAQQLSTGGQQLGGSGPPPPPPPAAAPSYPTSAGHGQGAGSQEMAGSMSGAGSGLYPQVEYLGAGRPSQNLGAQGSAALASSSSAPPNMFLDATGSSTPHQLAPQQSPGRPSAPPLMDMDYSPGTSMRPPALDSSRRNSAPPPQGGAPSASWLTGPPPAQPAAPGSGRPSTAAGAAGDGDDDGLCVVCMDAPISAGVLHGDTVHRCLCRDCAQHLKDSRTAHCPMCRAAIEKVLLVY